MTLTSSTTLRESQSSLHWRGKVKLYNAGMRLLGANIRKAREACGLTLEQVGAHFGISPQAVAQWEDGRTKSISHDRIKRLSKLLRIPISSIDGDAESDFYDLFELLMPEQKGMITTIVEALVRDNEKPKRGIR